MSESQVRELIEQVMGSYSSDRATFIRVFAELIVNYSNRQLVLANMSDPAYAKAMDEYYEHKWGHRFD